MRALGMNLPGLSSKSMEKRPSPPGQHGAKRRRALSNYGKRLKEKQKLRMHYGVSERQLRAVAAEADRVRGNAVMMIAQLLERRLDNIVFRAGLGRTIPAARQLVVHGHILVNGKPLTYPAARLKVGDAVSVREKGHVAVRAQQAQGIALTAPDWLDVDRDGLTARMTGMPGAESVPFPIELPLVVEFYS
jgi:small subunit ribosomal protein S4